MVTSTVGRPFFAPAVPRGKGGLGAALHALSRVLALLTVSGLVAFHLTLLWLRLGQGVPLGPAEILRWTAALPLLAAFFALRRFGLPVLSGRKAMVLWLIVVVLHAAAIVPPLDRDAIEFVPSADANALLAIPASVGSLALLLTAAFGLALASSAATLTPPIRGWLPRPRGHAPAPAGFFLSLASRPPPIG